jgi:hypothetical protein
MVVRVSEATGRREAFLSGGGDTGERGGRWAGRWAGGELCPWVVLSRPSGQDSRRAAKKRHIRFIKSIGRTNNISLIFSYFPSQLRHADPNPDPRGQLVTDPAESASGTQSTKLTRGPPSYFITFVYRGSLHRRKSAACPKFDMVWLYRSPIPVGRRGQFPR